MLPVVVLVEVQRPLQRILYRCKQKKDSWIGLIFTANDCRALGSDTGGSIRNPAARCGCYGFKPSYGLLSRSGMVALVNSFDSPGFFARNIDDIIHAMSNSISGEYFFWKMNAIIIDAVAGPDGEDATLLPKSFQPLKTSAELPKEKRKITIGLPDVRFLFSSMILIFYSIINRNMTFVVYRRNIAHVGTILFIDWRKWESFSSNESNYPIHLIPMQPIQSSVRVKSLRIWHAMMALNMVRVDPSHWRINRLYILGHHTKSIGDKTDAYEDILMKTRNESLGERVRGRILAGNYYLLEE